MKATREHWGSASSARGAVIAGLFVIFAGCGSDDTASPSDSTVAPIATASTSAAASTTIATTVAVASTTVAPVAVPALQAAGCPAISAAEAQLVNDALRDEPVGAAGRTGLVFAAATAGDDGAVRYIVGSIYDDTGFRVSSADTWVVSDGQLMALSGSANEYSDGLPDARDSLEGMDEGFSSPVQADLADCATAALQAG